MGNLSRDEISTLKVVRKTGRIASLPIPIFLKLIGLGLLVVSSGRTWGSPPMATKLWTPRTSTDRTSGGRLLR